MTIKAGLLQTLQSHFGQGDQGVAGERGAGVAIPASELAMHFDRGRQPMDALRCYAEAAEAALLNLSPVACAGLAERARALVPQAPQGAERDALELTLATLHGVSAFQALGVGAEAMTAFERAYARLGAHAPGLLLATYFDVPVGAGPAVPGANPGTCPGF